MKLKVCGMREAQNIEALKDLKPDYMGFIFWEPSKRYCHKVPKNIPNHIQKVGVFVDASLDEIQRVISLNDLQAVQLHGNETPALCESLFMQTQVIKAFQIGPDFDFSKLIDYTKHCHYFLFDTQGPLPGGNGTTFDWSVLKNYSLIVVMNLLNRDLIEFIDLHHWVSDCAGPIKAFGGPINYFCVFCWLFAQIGWTFALFC